MTHLDHADCVLEQFARSGLDRQLEDLVELVRLSNAYEQSISLQATHKDLISTAEDVCHPIAGVS